MVSLINVQHMCIGESTKAELNCFPVYFYFIIQYICDSNVF